MSNIKEEWKDIEGFEGQYQVSNLGRVRSLDTPRWNGGAWYIKKGRILTPRYTKNGYVRVQLNGKDYYIHRLVASHFVKGYFDGAEVDHINTIRDDNVYTNLRWVTNKENMNNDLTKEHRKQVSEKLKGRIFNNKIIYQYDLDGNYIGCHLSAMEIKRTLGYDNSLISKCAKGKLKKAYGYIWSYEPPIEEVV